MKNTILAIIIILFSLMLTSCGETIEIPFKAAEFSFDIDAEGNKIASMKIDLLNFKHECKMQKSKESEWDI